MRAGDRRQRLRHEEESICIDNSAEFIFRNWLIFLFPFGKIYVHFKLLHYLEFNILFYS